MFDTNQSDFAVGAAALASPGMQWTNQGLRVQVYDRQGNAVRVCLPAAQVMAIYERECAKGGFDLPATVGDFSVGGFFKKIGRRLKKISRKIGRIKVVRRFAPIVRKGQPNCQKSCKGLHSIASGSGNSQRSSRSFSSASPWRRRP